MAFCRASQFFQAFHLDFDNKQTKYIPKKSFITQSHNQHCGWEHEKASGKALGSTSKHPLNVPPFYSLMQQAGT